MPDSSAVLGRNGVGKTALLRAILGLMDQREGRIRLDGEEIAALRTHQRVKGTASATCRRDAAYSRNSPCAKI